MMSAQQVKAIGVNMLLEAPDLWIETSDPETVERFIAAFRDQSTILIEDGVYRGECFVRQVDSTRQCIRFTLTRTGPQTKIEQKRGA